ncbi:hypothetical protein ACQPYK_29330 [Streptosporangium sp. CA-135522]|uniref:hypothetical protein n=1 Tax=Streptosporangium sp. CA-135522 TaxID=3240072 RepID=UPI003D8EF102
MIFFVGYPDMVPLVAFRVNMQELITVWWTRRFWLWVVATVLSLLPLTMAWWLPGEVMSIELSFVGGLARCPAFDAQGDIWFNPIASSVLGWNGVVVPAAFVVWLLVRGGRVGRVAGWFAVGYVVFQVLMEPAFVAFDVVVGGAGCWQMWGPVLSGNAVFSLYQLGVALLIVLAVRSGRRRSRRARTVRRMMVAAVAIVVVLGSAGADQGRDVRFTGGGDVGDDACSGWTIIHRSYGDTPPRDRRRAFLCLARDADGYAAHLTQLPDRQLLAYGKALCGVAHLPADDPAARKLLDRAGADYGWSYALMRALVFLCPDAVGRSWPELVWSDAEGRQREKDYQVKQTSYCRDPLVRLRARRQATTALFVGEGGGYFIYDSLHQGGEEAMDALDAAFANGVVGVVGNSATVITRVENTFVCLTVKALAAAPPIMAKGWERVVEAGVGSPSGELALASWEPGDQLPNLAVAGPGRYRIRIYVRNQDKAAADVSERPVEEHLVVVFPGRSRKTIIRRR